MHVSYGLHNLRICFPFELVHLKVDISFSIVDMFNLCKTKMYIEFHAQVHRDRDGRKRILFAFIILQKRVLLLLCVHTNKHRVFTDLKGVSFLYEQK